MAKIGCLKPFRGSYDSIKDIVLEDGEIAFETTNKSIYMGNGVDTISNLSPFLGKSVPKVVSWSSGTDSEIVDLIEAADRGDIDLYQDAGWRVGDERVVHLSAMAATGVRESHVAQDVTFVLMHRGLYKDVNNKEVNFVIGMKDCLAETGYMDSSMSFSSWKDSARRRWCNSTFYGAVPFSICQIFKQVKVTTATVAGASTNDVTNDYFFLPAEKEIQGSMTYSNAVEANVLTQFEWYSTPSNKSKICFTSQQWYYNRSPHTVQSFCCTDANGTADHNNIASGDGNLSIHACI